MLLRLTVATLFTLLSANALAATANWTVMPARAGFSEVAAVGERGTRLELVCATSKTTSPRSIIVLTGPVHGGQPLKGALVVGPTHFNLEFRPSANAAISTWSARTAADERAFRAIAMRIRASKSPLKLRLGTFSERFARDGAKTALGAQAMQCPE